MSNELRFRDEIFKAKCYDGGIPDRDNLVVVDIGGHVGLFVEYIYPKASSIYVIEPYKPLFDVLVKRLEDTGRSAKTKAFNYGIAGTAGERKMYVRGGDGGSSLIYGGEDGIVTIQTRSLKDFMDENHIDHIDILKIDCEGAEGEIINSPEFKELSPKIDNIVGETHIGVDIGPMLLSCGYAYQNDGGIFSAYKVKEEQE